MTFRVTMKDTDVLDDAIRIADTDVADSIDANDGMSPAEREETIGELIEEVRDACVRWFKYSEYLTVEIDTEKMTCVVVEQKR